ncbi:MAG: hypothetical protein HQK53_13710 [Oligoflexia bacterium]|nr:hypothetical protein [Oligoflexia bacterium]
MTLNLCAKNKKILTEETLRKRLFPDNHKTPYWDYDFNKLSCGVEVEYLIGDAIVNDKLMKRDQYLRLITELEKHGFKNRGLGDQQYRVSKDIENGFIAIKPDFAFHILELAFPPFNSIETFSKILNETTWLIDSILQQQNLTRINSFIINPNLIDEDKSFVNQERLDGYISIIKEIKKRDHLEFSEPLFPACIAAIHIHLNASSEVDLRLIPFMYEMEPIIINKFNKFINYNTRYFGNNIRALIYNHTFGKNYFLSGFPSKIPRDLKSYTELYNNSDPIFPKDPFFPVRDYSFIRPTTFNTMEFRSLDTILDNSKILHAIAWRILQLAYSVTRGRRDNRIKKDSFLLCQSEVTKVIPKKFLKFLQE